MKKILVVLSVLLYSCSKGKLEFRNDCPASTHWNGWTEMPNAKAVYLVNKSSSERITFTVKLITDRTVGDKAMGIYKKQPLEIETKTYTLNPGEEKYLLCNNMMQTDDEKDNYKMEFEIVGEKVEN